MLNIAVLVSGGGTNLQAIIDAIEAGKITNGKIVKVISSKENVFSLERAKKHNIPTETIARKQYSNITEYNLAILSSLKACGAELVVLAGFMSILTKEVTQAFENKIINVHPALIPAFCGDGFYGLKVHEAALDFGAKVTGATVHFVNEITDGGAIILQKAVEIKKDDTPESLQKRVMEEAEWEILPEAINLICNNKLEISGRIVRQK
jgi:phosphoribosylglycinamide formyltransferase-1